MSSSRRRTQELCVACLSLKGRQDFRMRSREQSYTVGEEDDDMMMEGDEVSRGRRIPNEGRLRERGG